MDENILAKLGSQILGSVPTINPTNPTDPCPACGLTSDPPPPAL